MTSKASVQRLVRSPFSGQLNNGIRYESPRGGTDHIADSSHIIDAHEGMLKGVRAIVLDHYQRSTPGFNLVHQSTPCAPIWAAITGRAVEWSHMSDLATVDPDVQQRALIKLRHRIVFAPGTAVLYCRRDVACL
jgi:hypothetical protein